MKPAAASTTDAETARTDEQKRALIEEYDAADYKARYAMLDREQITIRDISRWRVALRAKLTVAKPAGRPATPRAKKKSATTKSSTPAVGTAPAAEPAPATRPRARRPAAAKATKAAVTAPPTATESGRRQRRRSGPAAAAAAALREAALTHAEQIVQHAEALRRLLGDGSWQALATATVATPDAEQLIGQVEVIESTGNAVEAALRPGGSRPATDPATAAHGGRGRKPWWGAAAE